MFWDEQRTCRSCENGGGSATSAPEAVSRGEQPIVVRQAAWTATLSNKVLLEVGIGEYQAHWGGYVQKQDPYTGDLVRMVEQCTAGCAANGNIAGLIYRSQSNDLFISGLNLNSIINWRANLSYVTGAHSFKAGFASNRLGDLRIGEPGAEQPGLPREQRRAEPVHDVDQQLPERPLDARRQLLRPGKLDAQAPDVQGAVRFDRAVSWAPAQQEGPARFLPQPISFPETPIVNSFKDLTPRVAAAYDLFGTGKTALKTTFGKYLEAAFTGRAYASGNPTSRIIQSVNRAWTDANNNWTTDCDPLNGNAQDLRASGGDFCGAFSNRNFGTTTFSNTIDPGILHGWGVRPSDWNLGASVQHELLPRMSVEVGYFWRWFQRLSRDRQPGHLARPISIGSASWRRPIHACPMAAATRCPISTTSTRRCSGSPTITCRSRTPTAISTRSSTGSTSR